MDEVTVTCETHVCEIRHGEFYTYDISPEQFGFERCHMSQLIGGHLRKMPKSQSGY